MSLEARSHTALHVLKGAAQKVLGTRWTTGAYSKGDHGRLTVQLDRKPTSEELQRVELEANRKVSEGAEILEFEMERKEAESHFGDEMYDVFRVPESVTRLKIVRIPDWNINCCVHQHVESTSAVGRIKVEKTRFRSARRELEFEFRVSD